MKERAQIRMLPDGRRLHLQDGPMDLVAEAFAPQAEVEQAYHAAATRFSSILDELCEELALLRQDLRSVRHVPNGRVAQRMFGAAVPYAVRHFITSMAAVAGAVAEEVLAAMTAAAPLLRAYVNDGGDIALHLAPGQSFVAGMVQRPDQPSLFGTTTIRFEHPVRGIATSGWRGRSFSLGIADAVTVLADTAAAADAAATIIANAVDLPGHPAIVRARACDLAPDSDLGERMVTQGVGRLTRDEVRQALAAGVREAEVLRALGSIRAAALSLQGEIQIVDTMERTLFQTAAYDPSIGRSLIHA